MAQAFRDPKRYRGFVLTSLGLQKLQECIQALEVKTGVHQGPRAIAERVQLVEPDGIHPMTVRKLLRCQQGVDKRSIQQVFAALQLSLEEGDYAHATLFRNKLEAGTLENSPKATLNRHSALPFELLTEPEFYGRVEERTRLRRQILLEQCQLIAVLGASGIGKTALVKKLSGEVEPAFECFVWKSLRHAPTLAEMLTELLQSSLEQLDRNTPLLTDPKLPTSPEGLITYLLRHLQQHRCFLVLDEVESILGNRPLAGYYREGYEGYGEVFRSIAESPHISCLILISQEKPRGLERLENQSAHFCQLQGLNVSASQQLLQGQGASTQLSIDWYRLSDYYAGNALLLKLVATRIVRYFNGNVADYLSQISSGQGLFQDIRDSLDQQFSRTSQSERLVMTYLAIVKDWVSLSALQTELNAVLSSQELLDVLDSLYRRSLLQKSGNTFKLSAAMAEFIQTYKC